MFFTFPNMTDLVTLLALSKLHVKIEKFGHFVLNLANLSFFHTKSSLVNSAKIVEKRAKF